MKVIGGYEFQAPPAEWWEQAASEDQRAFLRILFARRGTGKDGSRALRDRMLQLLGITKDEMMSKAGVSLMIDMHTRCGAMLSRIEDEILHGQSSLFEEAS